MNETSDLIDLAGVGPIKTNVFGEKYFYNLNRATFDKVSAYTLFETRFAELLFNEDSLNIVVGSDSGLLPRYVQDKGLPKGARYIFIEPAPILSELHAQRMLNDLDSRICCVSMDEWGEVLRQFKVVDYFYINAVRSFNAFCAQDDNLNQYAELGWHITELLSQLHWQSNMSLGSEAFIAQQIANLVDNKRPAKLLANAFAGKTVVLLAGGPSLDEALPWLKQHRQQVVVFAVSRISRRLQQVGIEPDFIFSVDPTSLSFDVSKEMLNFSERPIFVYSYHTVSSLVYQWPGISLYLGAKFPWSSVLNEDNFDGVGPTVTNTALNAAHSLGFKRIILAGVDLCFTKQGYTHAQGSNEHTAGPRFNLTSLQVATNGDFMAPTSCDFAAAINSLAGQAQRITATGCQIINISAGAAKVASIEYQALDDIVLDQAGCDVLAIVADRLANTDPGNLYYSKLADELRRSRFQVNAIKHLAENARAINEAMYAAVGVVVNFKDKKKLDQIEKKLKRDHRHFSRLVKRFGIRRFIQVSKPFSDEDWTAEEAKQLGNIFYEAYQDGAAKLLVLLDDALARVEARRQESLDMPDYKLLFEQSRKEASFGRVRVWQKRYATTAMDKAIAETFAEFERRFVEMISEQNTRHFAQAKSYSHLATVKQRASLLFKHNKAEELRDLLAALDHHEDQQAATPYHHLVTAYLAELEGQPDAALSAYQQIIEGGELLLEEALSRIAGISITHENVPSANLALQCLSQLNPLYLPLYADIQRLHGDVMVAVDAYSAYIGQFSEDIPVQIKLARLYAEQKLYDAAELMLDYILQQKPGLEAVLVLKRELQVSRAIE